MSTSIQKLFVKGLKALSAFVLWLLCLIALFQVIPPLLTQHFDKNLSEVPNVFKVAVVEKGENKTINWGTYLDKKESYQLATQDFTTSNNNTEKIERLMLNSNGTYKVEYVSELLSSWSQYKIKDNQVLPISYCTSGILEFFYAILGAFFLVWLLKILVRKLSTHYNITWLND